ncbi:sulfatase [Mucilaginibacter sp. PAMB04168]|uniref:sulfatase n=1 Tax=Mucilaginibacter sp. PAMB04168 TaxID=3138567 RepID=UPI0031F63235
MVDDFRPALGCYGDRVAVSPNIDRLAAMGTIFKSAYCQQAVCAPSRASFMTGKKPDHTKVWNLTTHFRKALPNVITMPEYFKSNGYYARQIGKIYHDPKAAQDARSWSVPELFAVTTNLGKYVLDSNLVRAPKANAAEAANVADSAYIDGMVANAAIKELQLVQKKPFFLAVGFRRPHLPFSAPLKYWNNNAGKVFPLSTDTAAGLHVPRYSIHHSVELRGYQDIPDLGPINKELSAELIKGYYTAVSFTDEQIGKVLSELSRLKLDQSTIVVILSDHGFHLGEHGMWGKTTNSKIDTRVPLIIYDPSQTKAPRATVATVELVDLYATLSDLCGLPIPKTDGQSFANIIKGKPYLGRGMAFSQFPDDMKFDQQPKVMGYAIHNNRFGYTEWIDVPTGKVLAQELYDYHADPAENANVAAKPKYRRQVAFFHQQVDLYRK